MRCTRRSVNIERTDVCQHARPDDGVLTAAKMELKLGITILVWIIRRLKAVVEDPLD